MLLKYNPKRWREELYVGGQYPTILGQLPELTSREVCRYGAGPRWVLQNWTKDWRYCQCSVGELAWLCGVGPYQMMGLLGRDITLQLVWLRWVLSYFGEYNTMLGIIASVRGFPGIPGFKEVQKRINDAESVKNIVTYDCVSVEGQSPGDVPRDFQLTAAKSRDPNIGVSMAPACRPWTAPRKGWGLDQVIEEHGGWWPDSPYAKEVEYRFKWIKGIQKNREKGIKTGVDTSTPVERTKTSISQRIW